MTHADRPSAPGPDQLREQIEQTRHDLGQTVQALADKTDVKARAQHRAGELKEQAVDKADEVKAQAAAAATQVQDRLPDSVKDTAAQAAEQVRSATARAERMWAEKAPEPLRQQTARSALAREHRTVLLAVAAGMTVLWLVARRRKD